MTLPNVRYDVIPLEGGLDQKTPTLSLKAGVVRDGFNFECAINGGYSRIGGYERVDGRAKPSDATYQIIQVTSFTNTPAVGDTLTGNTSGATGKIIAISTDPTPYMAITQVSGTFTSSEVVKVGATTIGTATPLSITISSKLNAQYLNLAADVYRALIAAVPGSGPVRGVVACTFSGVDKLYAFRDNAGGTACVMHVASGSGWTAVTLYNEVSFTAGGASAPADGATLTQGANTATIKRVVLQSGDWLASTAAGRFIVTTPAPGNFAAGAATIGAINVTLSGVQTAITLSPGGTYQFDIGNFGGQSTTRRIYGVSGVQRGFEFDGTTYVPITTSFSPDTPVRVRIHKNHLFYAFGSSIANSGIGFPYKWGAGVGAAETAIGDVVADMIVTPGDQSTGSMFVAGRNSTFVLYGTSASNWNLVTFNTETGAIPYSLQNLGQTYMFDDRGVINLQTAQLYGNFVSATLTQTIQDFIKEKRSKLTCSMVSKDKSQYRLFFSDNSGLWLTLVNGKLKGSLPVLLAHSPYCAWNSELANGDEVSYIGCTDGFVYQLDKGSSFDGGNLDGYLILNWNSQKSPRTIKTYFAGSLETQGDAYAEFSFGYSLAYGSADRLQPTDQTYATSFGGPSFWDSITWDMFYWDGVTLSPTEATVEGHGENLQVIIRSTTDYIQPYTLNSLILHYIPRRGIL